MKGVKHHVYLLTKPVSKLTQRIVSTLYICTVSVKCYDSAVVPDDINAGLLIPLVTADLINYVALVRATPLNHTCHRPLVR